MSWQPGAASGWTYLACIASTSTIDGVGSIVELKWFSVFGKSPIAVKAMAKLGGWREPTLWSPVDWGDCGQ